MLNMDQIIDIWNGQINQDHHTENIENKELKIIYYILNNAI